MAHIFSWSKRLLFFLHRITSVTPRYGGSYPAQLLRACNTSHFLSAPSWWVLDIIEHNWNTRKQKPLLIRHFDLILLNSLGVRLDLILANFQRVMTVLVFLSNHIQGNSTFSSPTRFFLFSPHTVLNFFFFI